MKKTLQLINYDQESVECELVCTNEYPWRIEIKNNDLGVYTGKGDDLFECLIDIRQKLETKRWFIMCAGNCVNVFPSRMSRQMSGGRDAYRLSMGKQCSEDSLVDIFEDVDPNYLGTVKEQSQFYSEWIASL